MQKETKSLWKRKKKAVVRKAAVVSGLAAVAIIIIVGVSAVLYMRHKRNLNNKASMHRTDRSKSSARGRKRKPTKRTRPSKSGKGPVKRSKTLMALQNFMKPKKMQAAEIDYKHTKQARLVMQADFKGEVVSP
ncbi:hypothetical protein OESDEN_06722 [Oesophagostomum dentatum]|uniref:Uncharacterized protein n=1 Tax=Oesophagostomum dentatum TaxID=61180 RepID=A0A0B1TC07_OESDE|nr:hypothetical protein OESDEN_06722 [Oesophagostomum dentatum]